MKMIKLSVVFLLSLSVPASGAIVAEDGFASEDGYVEGQTISGVAGGSGWTGPWEVDVSSGESNVERYQMMAGNLSYSGSSGDLLSRGGMMQLVARGSGKALARRGFPEQTGEVWFSYLAVLTTDSSWNWTVGLEGADEGMQVGIENYSGNSVYRLNVNGTTATAAGVDPYDDPGDGVESHLVVGRITGAGEGAGAGRVTIWINPSDLGDPAGGAMATATVDGEDLPALTGFYLDKGAAPEGFFDELRIGNSAGDVLPTSGGGTDPDPDPDPEPDPDAYVERYDFSAPETDSVVELEELGWDFSADQGTAEVAELGGGLQPFDKGLVIGGDTGETPRVEYSFGPWEEGAIDFYGYTRSSFSQARVALYNEAGDQLFAFFLKAPDKQEVEAGSGGIGETIIANGGTNDLLNNALGYSKYEVNWNGSEVSWSWVHYDGSGEINYEDRDNAATFQVSGTPATLVLSTGVHNHEQRQFGISNLRFSDQENGLQASDPADSAPERRDLVITTNAGAGADTFMQAGKTLDRGGRSYVASQRYSEVGEDDEALRQIYLRFDLGALEDVALVERAGLELVISHVGIPLLDHEFTIYGLQDGAVGQLWDELDTPFEEGGPIPPGSSLDYVNDNNINADATTVLGTVEWGGRIGETVSFSSGEMVDFLRSDTDGLVTLILQWTEAVVYDGTDDDRLQFASRENEESGMSAPALVFDIEGMVDDGLTDEEREAFAQLQVELADFYAGSSSEKIVGEHLSLLNGDGSFSDLSYGNAASYETHLARLAEMAQMYVSDNATYGGTTELLGELAASLDWWLVEDYIDSNWWWTYIGFPGRLAPIAATAGPVLETEYPDVFDRLTGYYNRVYEHLQVNPHGGGANLSDMSYNALVGAILERDAVKMETIREVGFMPVLQVLPATTNADGLRVDGSIYSHGPQLYNGTYGHELLNSSLNGIALLRDSMWELGDDALQFVEKILLDGVRYMTYGNWFDFNAMGRAVSRRNSHIQGRSFLNDIELLLELGPEQEEDLQQLYDKIRYDGFRTSARTVGVRSFWYTDFLTKQTKDYYTSVRMVSSRTEYNESGNGEGLKHRYFGDGVNFILVDGAEYDSIQPLWNYERLPGITAEQDGTVRPGSNWGELGRSDFAGSVNDGSAAVASMRLDHDGITGWKSWFLFDGVVAALGSDLSGANANEPVYTTLNQAIANTDATYGQLEAEVELTPGQDAELNGAVWVWQDNIGYVIPSGNDPSLIEMATVSGSWADLGEGPDVTVEDDVFTLSLNHGANPSDASYHYMILPDVAKEDTAAFASTATVEILANTDEVQAVHETVSGKTGIAFLQAGASVELPDGATVASDIPGVALLHADNGVWSVAAADPRHAETEMVLSIDRLLEGPEVSPDGSGGSRLSIPLPQGDARGAPIKVTATDPAVPGAQAAAYFGDLLMATETGLFESGTFGFFHSENWPWVWTFTGMEYWYITDSIPLEDGLYAYAPGSESWLYTTPDLFPWHYHYGENGWLRF